MREELDKELTKSFPNLYKNRYGDMKSTAMCWGFSCGDGWFELLKDLSKNLEELILKEPEEDRELYAACQVKEKYGTLRFYMYASTEEMEKLIQKAEDKSATICEICGEKGQLKGGGWLYVRCEKCEK